MFANIDDFDARDFILIKNAKVNNLKGINVVIPRNQLVVITGLSGSGKSSLAFDTLFAEGQRMYVESLNSYARQFLGRMEKPDVEYIKGISPAIAVEQKGNTKNPRATVGTTTEIYDYFKLLFARIGITYSPVSGEPVKKDTVTSVINQIYTCEEGQKLMILAPLQATEGRTLADELKIIFQKGFSRVVVNGELKFIEDLIGEDESIKSEVLSNNDTEKPEKSPKKSKKKTTEPAENTLHDAPSNYELQIKAEPDLRLKTQDLRLSTDDFFVLIDRAVVRHEDEDNQYRLADSVQTAFYEGHGTCVVDLGENGKLTFSDRFEADGMAFDEPSVQFFSFNNPYGACKRCGGFGNVLGIDEHLVIPDKTQSVYEGAIAPWRTEKMIEWRDAFVKTAIHLDFPIHRAYQDLNEKELDLLWQGGHGVEGIDQFFRHIESQAHKIQYRVMISRYRAKITCPDCKGTRLRKDAQYVKIAQKSIADLVLMPIRESVIFFQNLQLNENEQKIAKRILAEIINRLGYLDRVGLGYLTLNRLTATLSGGEYQRIKLATALGSALVGSMYILDEPSIGLHPRDTKRLVEVLIDLRDLGNTVIVVEHEEEIMQAADQILDLGPNAGSQGGDLILSMSAEELIKSNGKFIPEKKYSALNQDFSLQQSHTYNFLKNLDRIEIPPKRRRWKEFIEIKNARQHNLRNVTVKFPLDLLCVVTGVSGSGKSTLIRNILYPALNHHLNKVGENIGQYEGLSGSLAYIKAVEFVDQNPIGKSSRSNAATYTKVYDVIRDLYANQPLAKQRNYTTSHFSFNVDKGRCDVCEGEGKIKVEMQFMADVYLTCEGCGGKRFKKEILEVKFQDKDVAEVLDMTIDDCIVFFQNQVKIRQSLETLSNVGLGYVGLGQSATTLSGGEAQRLKLATFLKEKSERTLFIFDEPTTGLHFHDIKKLLHAINALIENGNSVLIIEHNLEVIKCADWVIDLGPDSGENGGEICFQGTPEDLIKSEGNLTGAFLKGKLVLKNA